LKKFGRGALGLGLLACSLSLSLPVPLAACPSRGPRRAWRRHAARARPPARQGRGPSRTGRRPPGPETGSEAPSAVARRAHAEVCRGARLERFWPSSIRVPFRILHFEQPRPPQRGPLITHAVRTLPYKPRIGFGTIYVTALHSGAEVIDTGVIGHARQHST
jgi:hypothetical protein